MSRRYLVESCGLFLLLLCLSCNEVNEPLPTGPDPPPPPPASQFEIVGHWEADSTQGRRIAFDVTEDGRVVNGRINLHHDCNTGRWRATLDGFEAQVMDSAFLTTLDWKATDGALVRNGTLTVSGRFEDSSVVKGGFVNSVNDVRGLDEQPTGDVCPAVQGSYEGNKE